ncbi:DUF6215 domain-containing protein [Streptomyces sp. NPDC007896]|uniref:DUF6215 domain-containing protein n=1 Tax=unclassified Streptomyces TaxID=2593676 RepID=UPI0036E536E0
MSTLLGTPAEQAETAGGNESSVKLAGGTEIALWLQDSVVPDDAALLSVAEKVLPTIPGWVSG